MNLNNKEDLKLLFSQTGIEAPELMAYFPSHIKALPKEIGEHYNDLCENLGFHYGYLTAYLLQRIFKKPNIELSAYPFNIPTLIKDARDIMLADCKQLMESNGFSEEDVDATVVEEAWLFDIGLSVALSVRNAEAAGIQVGANLAHGLSSKPDDKVIPFS